MSLDFIKTEEFSVQDATVINQVINQSYDTSGNGGRKLVRLDNGWLVCAVEGMKESNKAVYLYKSENNGLDWIRLCTIYSQYINNTKPSIVSLGNIVYILTNYDTGISSFEIDVLNQEDIDISNSNPIRKAVDTVQTSVGNCSLTINPQGTELHACWSSKNSTYPNSFNIRYAKGTINADGSVTWGSVEQVTKINSSSSPNAFLNPSIQLDSNGIPFIVCESIGIFLTTGSGALDSNNRAIYILKRSNSLTTSANMESTWTFSFITQNTSGYTQSSPSVIFVPSEINGLPQGRIWVAWHGTDSTHTTNNNIRVSYSDDCGITWSAMEKLTNINYEQSYPSITADKDNNIFIFWSGRHDTANGGDDIRYIKNTGGNWGDINVVKEFTVSNAQYPSTLFDTDFKIRFELPPVIYLDNENSKVGFYGTWTVKSLVLSDDIPVKSKVASPISAGTTEIIIKDIETEETIAFKDGYRAVIQDLDNFENIIIEDVVEIEEGVYKLVLTKPLINSYSSSAIVYRYKIVQDSGVRIKMLSSTYPNLSFQVENLVGADIKGLRVELNGNVIATYEEDLEGIKEVDLSDKIFNEGSNNIQVIVNSIAIREVK